MHSSSHSSGLFSHFSSQEFGEIDMMIELARPIDFK
jgi:hypothetical protein